MGGFLGLSRAVFMAEVAGDTVVVAVALAKKAEKGLAHKVLHDQSGVMAAHSPQPEQQTSKENHVLSTRNKNYLHRP